MMDKLKKEESELLDKISKLQEKIAAISSQLYDATKHIRDLIGQLNEKINDCRGIESEIKQTIEEFNVKFVCLIILETT